MYQKLSFEAFQLKHFFCFAILFASCSGAFAADVNLSEITNESFLLPVNTTFIEHDSTGSLFAASNIGYNTARIDLSSDSSTGVQDGNFLDITINDSISIDLLYDNPNPTSGGAFIIRMWTATWNGSNYVPTGRQHTHVFNWINDGQWHTYTQPINDFEHPIDDLSEVTKIYAYSIDAVQWDPVVVPYTLGVGSVATPLAVGITFDQPTEDLYPSWRHLFTGELEFADGSTAPLNLASLTWSSSDPAVADFDAEQGYITAYSPGTATLTAELDGAEGSVTVSVATPFQQPDEESNIDPALTVPMAGAVKEMPVVMITYVPTLDGINLDTSETSAVLGNLTVQQLKNRVDRLAIQTKFMLEERTKFRGYKDDASIPYLGYRIVKHLYVYEPMPRLKPHQNGKLVDYWPIVKRFELEDDVNLGGVKEIWINGYHTDEVAGWESNMSSPTSGDVSNSDRSNDDLPICDNTYIVYTYNFTRSNAENVHNHGHQLESMFSHLNHLQDGNTRLFWNDFVGRRNGSLPLGRVGDTHHPPNTTVDYDYRNLTRVESDIEDWQPAGGPTKMISALTWGGFDYDWPYGVLPESFVESQFYIYWMQNMPGQGNRIPHGDRWMENWWRHVHDWDASITQGLGLHTATPPLLPGDANQDGIVNFLDIASFISILTTSDYLADVDFNQDGAVTFLDINPFIIELASQ